jgi:hypothetical protein
MTDTFRALCAETVSYLERLSEKLNTPDDLNEADDLAYRLSAALAAEPVGAADGCHAAKDGECFWEHCPQLRDGEPSATGRHCPRDQEAPEAAEPVVVEQFVVRHYSSDAHPSIKGNGFDGLVLGENREEAQEFIGWINARLSAPTPAPVPVGEPATDLQALMERTRRRFDRNGLPIAPGYPPLPLPGEGEG